MARGITRRGFLAGALAAAATGCAAEPMPDIARASGPSSVPRRLAFGQARPATIDLQRTSNRAAASVACSVFEPLLRVNEDNELVPVLLTAVPRFEPDGLTLRCELKPNVTFHDGTPLTAGDVAYTFSRMLRVAGPTGPATLYQDIAGAPSVLAGEGGVPSGLVVEDDAHLSFVLERPNPLFCRALAQPSCHIFPAAACEAAGEDWGVLTAVGTGRYRFSGLGERSATLAPYEAYHGEAPLLDELSYLFYDDPHAVVEAFRAGEVDCCDLGLTYGELAEALEDPELKPYVSAYETTALRYIGLNLNHEFLRVRKLREALSASTDRISICMKVLGGAGVAATGCLGLYTPGYDPDQEPFIYDFDYAKQLVEETGTLGLGLECHCLAGDDERFMLVVEDYWKEIGIDLHVNPVGEEALAEEVANGTAQVVCWTWEPPFADGQTLLRDGYRSDAAATRSSFYDNPAYDDLVDRAALTSDGPERAELWRQADHLLCREDFAMLPIYWPKGHLLARDHVVNFGVSNMVFDMSFVGVDVTDEGYRAGSAG